MWFRHGAQRVRRCLGIVVTLGTAACAPSPDASGHSVEYYREQSAEREARLAECVNEPGGIGRSRDCSNAREAARIEGVGSLRDLPPLDLPKPDDERPASSDREDPR